MSEVVVEDVTFVGNVWSQEKFQKFQKYIKENECLTFFNEFANNDIDYINELNLLVDRNKIKIEIDGLEVDGKQCEEEDNVQDGVIEDYSIDVTIICNNENAIVDLNSYPELLYFLKHKDKHDAVARQEAYKKAIETDETGLIAREFGEEFKAEYRYFVSPGSQ